MRIRVSRSHREASGAWRHAVIVDLVVTPPLVRDEVVEERLPVVKQSRFGLVDDEPAGRVPDEHGRAIARGRRERFADLFRDVDGRQAGPVSTVNVSMWRVRPPGGYRRCTGEVGTSPVYSGGRSSRWRSIPEPYPSFIVTSS